MNGPTHEFALNRAEARRHCNASHMLRCEKCGHYIKLSRFFQPKKKIIHNKTVYKKIKNKQKKWTFLERSFGHWTKRPF